MVKEMSKKKSIMNKKGGHLVVGIPLRRLQLHKKKDNDVANCVHKQG